MFRYVVMRIAAVIPTLFAIIVLSFILMRLAPGGPFDGERPIAPEVMQNLRHIYRLDLPLFQQFGFYVWSLLHGDFGPSYHWRDFAVSDLLAHALPISLLIGVQALVLALVLGIGVGLLAALRPGGIAAHLAGLYMLLALAVPNFVVAPLLQLVFGLMLRMLPVGGFAADDWKTQILPVVTLALPQIAIIARLTEAALRDVLGAPHIRTLRAFGLPAMTVYGHASRAALLPVLSYLGPAAANLLTGSVVVETVFGIPGLGRYFVTAALGRDYTLVMAIVIIVALLVMLFNLIVDLLYVVVDPRIGQGGRL
jgi:oligopeptide transport system permease protein